MERHQRINSHKQSNIHIVIVRHCKPRKKMANNYNENKKTIRIHLQQQFEYDQATENGPIPHYPDAKIAGLSRKFCQTWVRKMKNFTQDSIQFDTHMDLRV